MVQNVADQSTVKKTKREEPAQSSKLDALEAELRSDNKVTQAKTDSQLAGNASAPTPDQRQKLQQYAPTDDGFDIGEINWAITRPCYCNNARTPSRSPSPCWPAHSKARTRATN